MWQPLQRPGTRHPLQASPLVLQPGDGAASPAWGRLGPPLQAAAALGRRWRHMLPGCAAHPCVPPAPGSADVEQALSDDMDCDKEFERFKAAAAQVRAPCQRCLPCRPHAARSSAPPLPLSLRCCSLVWNTGRPAALWLTASHRPHRRAPPENNVMHPEHTINTRTYKYHLNRKSVV
jgi:hypothetical protein